jgi:hypothetical protein
MIADPNVRAGIQAEWRGAIELRARVQRSLLGAFAQGGSSAIFAADAAHNLPMIHGFGVLNNVLLAFRDQGRFSCKGFTLGPLMDASRTNIPWLDFDNMKAAVRRRNEVAHDGVLLPRGECWTHLDAISAQLTSWSILSLRPALANYALGTLRTFNKAANGELSHGVEPGELSMVRTCEHGSTGS